MRILVEDAVLVVMMLTDSLKSSGGCQEHGYTGREARHMVSDLPPRARKNTYWAEGEGRGGCPNWGSIKKSRPPAGGRPRCRVSGMVNPPALSRA